MIARANVFESKLRLAHHYVEVVCKANADYRSGFERSLNAIKVFDDVRLQVETTVDWLIRYAEDDEIGKLLVNLLRDGYQLLYARMDTAVLQTWLEHGLKVARRIGDKRSEAAQLLTLGYASSKTHSLTPSRPLFEEAYELAQQCGDQLLQMHSLHALAKQYEQIRELDEAARCNQQAYELSLKLGHTLGMYEYFNTIAVEKFSAGDYAEASRLLNEAYAFALKAGAYREISMSLAFIGSIHYQEGHFQESIPTLRQALDFALRTEYPPVIVYSLHALANSLTAAQDFPAAQEVYLQALHMSEQFHLDEKAGAFRGELGIVAFRQNEFRLAQDYLEVAVKQLHAVGSDFYYHAYLNELVPVYLALGEYTYAERTLHQAIEFATNNPNDETRIRAICSAIQIWTFRVLNDLLPDQLRLETAEIAVIWSGCVLAAPNTQPENRLILQNQLAKLSLLFDEKRIEQHLQTGHQLDLNEVYDQVRASLGQLNQPL